MPALILGFAILAIVLGIVWLFVNTDARTLIRTLRYVVGSLLLVVGAALLWGGRATLGMAMLLFGFTALAQGRIGPFTLGGTSRGGGQGSKVNARFLEMVLDHDTGTMTGRVIAGAYAGRQLDDLAPTALRQLLAEIAADADSVRLLEAYLDRRQPGWRDDVEEDVASGPGGTPGTGAMSKEEAYQILGLQPGAGEAEIRAAHRRLMKRYHPDQGGSTFLAVKINEAKERLLGNHR